MRLQILSDLHLGVGAMEVPQTDADIVILAGDIARPKEAVSWASAFPQPVLYVIGNHEFYGGSLDQTVEELRRLCAGTRIRLLDNDEEVIGGVRFLGSTLWTDFRLFDADGQRERSIQEAQRFMRDFSRIRTTEASPTVFTPADSAKLFARHVEWLEKKLGEYFPGPTVVITHHAPSPRSIHPRFIGSLINACFVSDAERIIDGNRVPLWIHGHTHDSFDYVVNGTRVVCNARGYAKNGMNENSLFNPSFVIDLPSVPVS
ncbi:MAG: metallophosphoesterase [Acidobacteriia bacterium]|nr:metallophosphoesterase [Terriglobia bacterium]